jgi:ADP-ribose pyrophosphatase
MRRVFEGRVFSVEVGQKAFPNGSVHDVALVRHRPSVVLLPMMDDGRVLLIRQYRPSVERVLWELPAGSTYEGEVLEQGAIRECAEETGYVPGSVERLVALYPAPGFCDELLVFFRVTSLRPIGPDSPYRPDADEDIETRAVTIVEAKAMVADGQIEDLKTAYGLTLV